MNGKRGAVTLMVLFLVSIGSAFGQRKDQCFECHTTLGDRASELFKMDVHQRKGISCAGCHGGDSTAEEMEQAMAPATGFIGVPKGDDIIKVCARCHADKEAMKQFGSDLPVTQASMLEASVHGKASVTGGQRILQCATCHASHGVVSVKNLKSPVHSRNVVATCGKCHSDANLMRRYNPALAVDQVEKYRTSGHGQLNARGDVNVAECASCHGSHEIRAASDVKSTVYATNLPLMCAGCHSDSAKMRPYGIPTNQFQEFAESVHGKALLEKKDLGAPACNDCHGNHGAIPPGVESISKVCGTCHALNAELFSSSPHKKAFDAQKLPECETCHGNHKIVAATDELLGIAAEATCSRCHTPEKNVTGFWVARTMRGLIDSLEKAERLAALLLAEAEQKGMEISEARFKLRDARQARLQARTMVHSFHEGQFREVVEPGLRVASFVQSETERALEEYTFRRVGLGLATLIITLLAAALYLYIRRIERNPPDAKM
jgi:predicted CXXCH cytochrome family protein